MNVLLFSESVQIPPFPPLFWLGGRATAEEVEYLWTWNPYCYPLYSSEVLKRLHESTTKEKELKKNTDTKSNRNVLGCSVMKLSLLKRKLHQWIHSLKHCISRGTQVPEAEATRITHYL